MSFLLLIIAFLAFMWCFLQFGKRYPKGNSEETSRFW